jgi:hypothetical protein
MSVHVLIEAFEEEALIGEAVRSALEAGADHVHVWDGAFHGYADHSTSHDDMLVVARRAGAIVHEHGWWHDRAEKRTAIFQQSGCKPGDHVLLLDADERMVGVIPRRLKVRHALVSFVNVGPNDMPGVRKEWPRGDYSTTPYPALRILSWSPELRCVMGGSYADLGGRIFGMVKGEPVLPVIAGLLIEHHAHLRTEAEVEARRSFYTQHEQPQREAIKKKMREAK